MLLSHLHHLLRVRQMMRRRSLVVIFPLSYPALLKVILEIHAFLHPRLSDFLMSAKFSLRYLLLHGVNILILLLTLVVMMMMVSLERNRRIFLF
jgi:hypothetical protein